MKNVDLWQRLDDAIARHRVDWKWVKGHSGVPENERADELARLASEVHVAGLLASKAGILHLHLGVLRYVCFILVIAGAGSGKTRTLTYRVARLVEAGVLPRTILLLTFTRKASQEMLQRASRLLDDRCENVSGGTFHSFANAMLRRHAAHLGYDRSFTIIDRADMENLIVMLKKEIGILISFFGGMSPRVIAFIVKYRIEKITFNKSVNPIIAKNPIPAKRAPFPREESASTIPPYMRMMIKLYPIIEKGSQ